MHISIAIFTGRDWAQIYDDHKQLIIPLAAAIAGAILTKLLPAVWASLRRFGRFLGRLAGGRLAFRSFQGKYLNWLVIDQRELKLTGIVSSEESKKPRLEQVFVSLRVAAQKSKNSEARTERIPEVWEWVETWNDLHELLVLHHDLTGEDVPMAAFRRRRRLFRKTQRAALKRSLNADPPSAVIAENDAVRSWLDSLTGLSLHDTLADFQLRRVVRDEQRFAILGSPGAGKTTLLQYIALTFARYRAADPKLRDKYALRRRLGVSTWRLPIVIRLSSIASLLADETKGNRSILDVLARTLPPDLQADPASQKYFAWHLAKGNCLILLDGLDEVPTDPEFQAVVRAIESLAVMYEHNQFIVTSRVAGWRSGIGADFKVFYVQDLTERQTNQFIDTWYQAVERNAVVGRLKDEGIAERSARERRWKDKANDLKNTLKDNLGIRRLAVNPMLLSIIALVHRSLATLPKERSKLYAQCSEILLEQWDISRGLHVDDTGLKLEQKEAIMRRLAFAYHTGEIGDAGGGREASFDTVRAVLASLLPSVGKEASDADRLLRRLIERSGVLTERQRNVLAFSHHTFQEYFTAQFLAAGETAENREFLLEPARLLSDWWREVILLYAGLLTDTSEFIRLLYQHELDDLCQQRLRLAGMCIDESVSMDDVRVRQTVVHNIRNVRTAGLPHELGSNLIPPVMADYLVRWTRHYRWFSQAAKASVRSRIAAGSAALLADIDNALRDPQSAIKEAAAEIVTLLPSSQVSISLVSNLFALSADKVPSTRAAALRSIAFLARDPANIEAQQRLVDALLETDEANRGASERRLRKLAKRLNPAISVAPLEKLAVSDRADERRWAAQLFPIFRVSYQQRDVDLLVRLLNDSVFPVALTAAEALGSFKTQGVVQSAVALFANRLEDPQEGNLRRTAALFQEFDPQLVSGNAIARLARLLMHDSESIRREAALALVHVGSEASLEVVRHVAPYLSLAHRNESLAALIVFAAIKGDPGQPALFDTLRRYIETGSRKAKVAAIYALQVLTNSSEANAAHSFCLRLLRARKRNIRIAALHSAVQLRDGADVRKLTSALLELLHDSDKAVQRAAVIATAVVWSHDADPALLMQAFDSFSAAINSKQGRLARFHVDIYLGDDSRPRFIHDGTRIVAEHSAILHLGQKSASEVLLTRLLTIYSQHKWLLETPALPLEETVATLRNRMEQWTDFNFDEDIFSRGELAAGAMSRRVYTVSNPVWGYLDIGDGGLIEAKGSSVARALAHWLPADRLADVMSPWLTQQEHMQQLAFATFRAARIVTTKGAAYAGLLNAILTGSPQLRTAAIAAVRASPSHELPPDIVEALTRNLMADNRATREGAWATLYKHKAL